MTILSTIRTRLTDALEAKAAALEAATGRLEKLDEVAPLGDLFGPAELDALDERRLWDDTVKELTAGVDPNAFADNVEAGNAGYHIASFADALVLARRDFFAGGVEEEDTQ